MGGGGRYSEPMAFGKWIVWSVNSVVFIYRLLNGKSSMKGRFDLGHSE